MKLRLFPAIVITAALTAAAAAQDSGSTPPAGQNASPGSGGGYGQHAARSGFGGRGLTGTVTDVAADHYTIKTDPGDVYTVRFTSETRIVKQAAGMHAPGGGSVGMGGGGQSTGGGMGRGFGGNPPQEIKATDIKVGDAIGVMGNVNATAKSVSALRIVQLDPEVVRQMREMQANFGKTWLQGKVTAIDGTKITLTGTIDNAPYTVVADENTAFRKHREPVTLADIQVGDTIRVEGAVKDRVFTATSVNVAGMMGGETPALPRNSPPQ